MGTYLGRRLRHPEKCQSLEASPWCDPPPPPIHPIPKMQIEMPIPTLFRCGPKNPDAEDYGNDGPADWFEDRSQLEGLIRDNNLDASDEELEAMYQSIKEVTPSPKEYAHWLWLYLVEDEREALLYICAWMIVDGWMKDEKAIDMKNLLGQKEIDFVGRTMEDFLSPDDLEYLQEAITSCISDRMSSR